VLPIVFGVVFFLIFVGYAMHQRPVMEAATQRSAIYIARTITDPSYEKIVSGQEKIEMINDNLANDPQIYDNSILNRPYRYLFSSKSNMLASSEAVAKLIMQNQIFSDKRPNVSVEKEGGLFPKVTVSASQKFDMPQIIPGFDLPTVVTIESTSVVYINQPAEFIRNADFVIDVISTAVESIKGKVDEVFSKITFFKSNVAQAEGK
jgi:hypothetical protein